MGLTFDVPSSIVPEASEYEGRAFLPLRVQQGNQLVK